MDAIIQSKITEIVSRKESELKSELLELAVGNEALTIAIEQLFPMLKTLALDHLKSHSNISLASENQIKIIFED